MLTKEKCLAVDYEVFEPCYQQIIKELTLKSLSLLRYSTTCLTSLEISEEPKYRGEYLLHVLFLASCKKIYLLKMFVFLLHFY